MRCVSPLSTPHTGVITAVSRYAEGRQTVNDSWRKSELSTLDRELENRRSGGIWCRNALPETAGLGGEIFRVHLIEELPELLDLLLLIVLDEDARLGQDLLGGEYRDARSNGKGDRIGWPARNLE